MCSQTLEALIALNYSLATMFIRLDISISHIIKNILFDLFCSCDHLLQCYPESLLVL